MRFYTFSKFGLALFASAAMVLGGVLIGTGAAPAAYSQSLLAGDITGTVLDPSGSVVTGATVTATNKSTEATASVKTDAQGAYRFALLKPGVYQVSVKADGFKEESVEAVVSLGQIATVPLHLNVGSEAQTVEVTETAQLLQADSAELNTSFSYEQLQSVPNPGGDITYVAQTAPGVVMNTTGGDGNFSVFGMPATSNNFTMNGMEVNDPFLNLNNSGPSNLLLGLNDVAEVNVVTNAYGAQMGQFGGAQLNAVSRSGGNAFHGNANYWWNGRSMNANDWFNAGNPKPFSNSNQYSAAVGGPIKKDHTFFFANWEQLSFITAPVQVVLLPSASYEAGVLGSDGHCDNASSSLYAAGTGGECAFYANAFSLYNGTANHANATVFSPDQLQLTVTPKTILNEHLFTSRIDQSFGDNDKVFGHFKYDEGTQPTATDLINPVFNANSVQPDYEGQLSWTHIFSPRAVNQLLLTGSWYSAIFKMANQTAATAAFPETLNFSAIDGYFADLNTDGFAFPEGRNASQVQLGDDFSYSLGKHTLKAGVGFKKDYISDFDVDEFATPLVLDCGSAATCAASVSANANLFGQGVSVEALENFTTHPDLGISLYSLGVYFQDDWKPTPNVTLTLGARVERNSNPSCAQNCLSNFGTNFGNFVANIGNAFDTTPYSSMIKAGQSDAFTNYQRFMVEPRFGFTYSPSFDRNTVVRGGAGLFTDVFPGIIADQELGNAPLDPAFIIYSGGIDPSQSYSSANQAATLNRAFQNGYANGGSLNSISAADPNFAPPNMITTASHVQYPSYTEWSLEIQHQFPHNNSLQVEYVGNKGYHEPVQNESVNAYGSGPFPATAPAPAFGQVTEISSTASSNYAGFVASVLHKGKSLNLQFNYTYSHALDEVSNGGILVFNATNSIEGQVNPYDLRHNYGNADYDTRHYLNGNYLYLLPYFRGPRAVTGGWELSGTLFLHTGLPFSATESDYVAAAGNVGNVSTVQVASTPGTSNHCGSSAARTACLSAASFPTAGVASSIFAPEDRNQFTGPGYFDTDMTLAKSVPLHEGVALKFGVSAYNLFNHPNFATPVANVSSPQFGQSLQTVSPPTSIYGFGLGGDASVRIVQLTGKFTF